MQMFFLGSSQIGWDRVHPQPPFFGTRVELVDDGRLHESENQALNLQERSKNQAKKHQCPQQETQLNAKKHLLARQAAEGGDECNT